MEQAQLNWITNFIWGIADDVLKDAYGFFIQPTPILAAPASKLKRYHG